MMLYFIVYYKLKKKSRSHLRVSKSQVAPTNTRKNGFWERGALLEGGRARARKRRVPPINIMIYDCKGSHSYQP